VDLGRALALADERQTRGMDQVCGLAECTDTSTFEHNGMHGTASDAWACFGKILACFVDKQELTEEMQNPEAYAKFIGIMEQPVAVLMYNLAVNGCWLECLVCTETKVYQLVYSNG
ncbi:unnamed protein product, partial [Polarella glacialis]